MTDLDSGAISRLRRWFWEGPNEDDGTIGWMVGMTIWWRMAAMSVVAVALVGIVAISVAYLEPFFAALASAAAGFWAGGWTMKISPKYDVTKNY